MPASSLNRSRLSASLENASGLSAAARSSERLMVSFNRSRSAVTSSSSVMPVALTRLRKRYEPLQADCHQSNSARDRPRAFIDSGDVKAEMAKEPLHSRSYSAVLGHVVMRHSLSRSFHAHHCSRRCHRAPRPTHRQGAQRAGRHRAPAGSARLASRQATPSPALRLNKRPTIGSRIWLSSPRPHRQRPIRSQVSAALLRRKGACFAYGFHLSVSRLNCGTEGSGESQGSRRMIQPSCRGIKPVGASSRDPNRTSTEVAWMLNRRPPQSGQKDLPWEVRTIPVYRKASIGHLA